ncbi:MAG: hypothetical protein AAF722_06725 [Cyanobacteria bacterium P01_C01_bin.70]
MGTAYPIAPCQKALAAFDRGEKKLHVSQMFGINRNTLDEWWKRRAAMGQVSAKGY